MRLFKNKGLPLFIDVRKIANDLKNEVYNNEITEYVIISFGKIELETDKDRDTQNLYSYKWKQDSDLEAHY